MFGPDAEFFVRGVAAAREGDREQARFYLERVLYGDADDEQKVEAWYWLSRAATDPAERRRCLEEVLAAAPGHPEARRDLAILDGRLRPEELVDLRRPVAPLTPRDELGPGEVRTYRCPECGGALTYAVEARSLVCQFCGYRGAVPEGGEGRGPRGEGRGDGGTGGPSETAEEQDWDAAIYTARGHRWALPAERVYVCQGCGSRQVIPPGMEGADCAFCGSPHVAPVEAGADLIEPAGVAPFAFEWEEARERAWRWLAGQRFRPHDLDELAAVATPRPIYLPYWTFDLSGELTWHGYRKGELGRRVAVSGSQPVLADDVPVPAGGALPEETLAALRFDTRALVPYTPDLLAGWPAEIYRLPLADASLRARERVVAEARPRIEAEVGQGVEELRVGPAGLSVASYKLALLPVWLASYAYKGERRSLVVNGQSGEVHGEVPRNPLQAFLARLGE